MGHQNIGALPATRQWKAVIELIAGGGNVAAVAAATSDAAELNLAAYSRDPAVRKAVYLLTQIPLAARSDMPFPRALRGLGLSVDSTDLIHISAACLDAIDNPATQRRSDLGEMVALSAVESLQATARRSLDDLFGSQGRSAERTREVLAGLATVKQFGILAQDFFSRLLRRHLSYYLSRELPNHVGLSERFTSLREHSEFDEALELHCREVARIVTRFAGEWLSKNNFEGGITEEKAGGFVFVALDKIRKELRIRRGGQ